MKDHKRSALAISAPGASIPNRILGTLRDALHAASRESTGEVSEGVRLQAPRFAAEPTAPPQLTTATAAPAPAVASPTRQPVSAAEALREAKAPAPEPVALAEASEPTTRIVRGAGAAFKPAASLAAEEVGRTQAVRGKPKLARSGFHQDPVVGWVVVVGGPGLGAFRSIYEGNNTLGRSKGQRIPIDLAMSRSPPKSKPTSAMIRSIASSCSFPTWPRPTSSPSTTKNQPGRCHFRPWM